MLLNDGNATAFTALPTFELERDPRLLRAARIDASMADTLLVLNTNSGRNEEIVFLRATTGVVSAPAPAVRITGTDPVDFVTGDFNRDGATDIVVLHDEDDRDFFVSVLLNQTASGPGGTEPTGSFLVRSSIPFNCPTEAGGDLTRCIPEAIAAGDFDRDGFTDLAVSFSRPPELMYLNGLGGGEFGVAGRFRSETADEPVTIVAGDMTGNRAADLLVGDTGTDTIALLRADVPAPHPDGSDCSRGNECNSSVCLDGVCCRFLTCPSGQRCDIPGREGSCAPLAPLGTGCEAGDTCTTGFCVDEVCCANPSCGEGQTCARAVSLCTCSAAPPTATPTPTPTRTPFPTLSPTPQPDGRGCSGAVQCQSGLCRDGVCCGADCPDGQFCNISDSPRLSAPRKFIRSACFVDTDCLTRNCDGGLCAAAPTPTPVATATPTATRFPKGSACLPAAAESCSTGFCTDGVCCSEPACAVGERCDIFEIAGDCRAQLGPGAECARDSDCRAGSPCDFDEAAGRFLCARTTPTPGAAVCFGDCNADDAVTVDEILVLIEIALGTQALGRCPAGDIDGDRMVAVNEILTAVGFALTGCPPPGPPTATPDASTPVSTATPTPIAPTASPTASPSTTPAPVSPTPTATATPPGIDLSGFDEFRFMQSAEAGACPPVDSVYSAAIDRAGPVWILEMDVLRAGDAETDPCLPDVVGSLGCVVAEPVSLVATILTAAEVERLPDVFGSLTFAQVPAPTCVEPQRACDAATYRWDAIGANDDPCSDTNRLPADLAETIGAFLEDLAAARLAAGE